MGFKSLLGSATEEAVLQTKTPSGILKQERHTFKLPDTGSSDSFKFKWQCTPFEVSTSGAGGAE